MTSPTTTTPIPTLDTDQLRLRPFAVDDAPVVRQLAGVWEVADPTLYIPHPYPEGAAEEWIGTHAGEATAGTAVTWAITRRDDAALLGAMTLGVSDYHRRGDLGYWVGVPFWNRGYTTEAARAVLAFAFASLALHRVQAGVFARNPASGRVLEKVGMRHEGVLRGYYRKGEVFEDALMYAVVQPDVAPVTEGQA